jgi:hypothetical protein
LSHIFHQHRANKQVAEKRTGTLPAATACRAYCSPRSTCPRTRAAVVAVALGRPPMAVEPTSPCSSTEQQPCVDEPGLSLKLDAPSGERSGQRAHRRPGWRGEGAGSAQHLTSSREAAPLTTLTGRRIRLEDEERRAGCWVVLPCGTCPAQHIAGSAWASSP